VIPASVSDPDLELNFGWPCYEGAPGEPHRLEMFRNSPTCVALVHGKNGGAVLPEFSYAHAEGAAVVLGPLYRGGPYPDEFDGRLFFADYLRDAFWTLEGSRSVNLGTGKGAWRSPVDLELTPTGTLAYASLTTGELVEITYSPPRYFRRPWPSRSVAWASSPPRSLRGRSAVAMAREAPSRRHTGREDRAHGTSRRSNLQLRHVLRTGARHHRAATRLPVARLRLRGVDLFLIVIWAVTEHERTDTWPQPFNDPDATSSWTMWVVYPIFGWGLILAFHAFVTYRQPVTASEVDAEVRRLHD